MKDHWIAKGLGKKNKGGTIIISEDSTTKLQNQNSIVLVFRRTWDQWNRAEKPEINLVCVQPIGFSTKAPRVLEKGQSPNSKGWWEKWISISRKMKWDFLTLNMCKSYLKYKSPNYEYTRRKHRANNSNLVWSKILHDSKSQVTKK